MGIWTAPEILCARLVQTQEGWKLVERATPEKEDD